LTICENYDRFEDSSLLNSKQFLCSTEVAMFLD